MFNTYPRLLFKERRIVYSYPEMMQQIKEGMKSRKQILVSLYSFNEIKDRLPVDNSVNIDLWAYTGPVEKLRELGKMLRASDIYSMLLFDGKEYILLAQVSSTLEELDEAPDYPGVKINKSIHKMIVYPGTVNLETKKRSEIVEVFDNETTPLTY